MAVVHWCSGRCREPISGVLVLVLSGVALLALAVGWTWAAVPAALGILGAAAWGAGADTRDGGDW